MATKVVSLELTHALPLSIAGAENYACVRLIVMRRGVPIGHVDIDNHYTPVQHEQIVAEVVRYMSTALVEDYEETGQDSLSSDESDKEGYSLLADLKPQPGKSFFLSIVVCTRDRPQDLRNCLKSMRLLEQGRHRLEVIVVDNNPASGQTRAVVDEFPEVRYEVELRPGVAYARNQGLRAAKGDIVAYIDDDVTVPACWPARILAPFADHRVMCVSGLVLPLEMETPSQEFFELYGGLSRGYQPRLFDDNFFNRSRRHVVPTWELGGTANVAIRKAVTRETGMFDETLGPGLPTGVGEDIYMFYRILRFGHLCYYEPAAYVWHKHRREMSALARQLYSYSKGQTSYQLRTLVSDNDKRVIFQFLWDLPSWHVHRIWDIVRGRSKYPLKLVVEEIRGNLMGPYAFYKANKMHRELNGPNSNPITSDLVSIED
ncbi:MAG TPA: glycosyltransferase [Chloroflexia bacterium]|nr:glycosyltransferase [Chloroflexia bacterium]